MKHRRRRRPPRGSPGHRNRRALRRRRRHRPVDEPDVDRDLQDPDRAQGALLDRHQPASVGRQVHHPRRGGHGRGGAARRRAAGAISWMTTVTLEGTQELMKHRDVAVILATGGMGLVRAAYSAGKPAYGVGPGNAPAYIERHRRCEERPSATSSPARRSTTASSARRRTPSSSTRRLPTRSKREFQAQGGYFMPTAEMDAVASVLVTPQRLPNPALVGKSRERHCRESAASRFRPRRGC